MFFLSTFKELSLVSIYGEGLFEIRILYSLILLSTMIEQLILFKKKA